MQLLGTWQTVLSYIPGLPSFNAGNPQLSGTAGSVISLSKQWQVLGPWQIGTREAAWGSDPTEQYGGFHQITYDTNDRYRSSIANNGTTTWAISEAKVGMHGTDKVVAELEISFDNVDWSFLQQVYGWAALQWQAWVRGNILIDVPFDTYETCVLHTEGILEYWIDGQHYYGGDFYSYRRAPHVLRLGPGSHTLDLRLIRDVRAMGGVGPPNVAVKLILERQQCSLSQASSLLISDLVAETRRLSSPYASVYVTNSGEEAIFVQQLRWQAEGCSLDTPKAMAIAPGQTRPVTFQIECKAAKSGKALLQVIWKHEASEELETLAIGSVIRERSIHEPQKVTFLHPSGIVSYAVLRPPYAGNNASCRSNASLPVLIAMHGAGLEADDDLVKHSLDPISDLCAWVLFPTGVTPWSGDDWHTWGFADVEAALDAIPRWIDQNAWKGPGVLIEKWLVTGHSNGGQGTWYSLTHRPDNIIAAAPLSGYSSIQKYVPYTFWQSADPSRMAIVQATLNAYKHELLLENARDIPIFQQHGSADDNVPAYHSRLLSELLQRLGGVSDYVEVPHKPHWWPGVMTTSQLVKFFRSILDQHQEKNALPANRFTVISGNPIATGPKQGFEIHQLMNAGQLGRLDVHFGPLNNTCIVHTSNIRAFGFAPDYSKCTSIRVEGEEFHVSKEVHVPVVLEKTSTDSTSKWSRTKIQDTSETNVGNRIQKQSIGMDGILRTSGPFQIVSHTRGKEISKIALQISRNLCQYFAADTELRDDYESAKSLEGNIISITVADDLPAASKGFNTIAIRGKILCILEAEDEHCYGEDTRIAAIFLRPLVEDRLELVVWAAQERDLHLAARLVPMLTGTGLPDFVVVSSEMIQLGLEGVLALGFYNERWGIARSTFYS